MNTKVFSANYWTLKCIFRQCFNVKRTGKYMLFTGWEVRIEKYFVEVSRSEGGTPVVECGAVRYRNKNRCCSCCQGRP